MTTSSPSTPSSIQVRGAHVNNLRGISVDIPKHAITVFTGVSGSGKSSLVFDTIAAESQRLINETYSSFVQGFMPSLPRPDVDALHGLTTAIVIDQAPMGSNPRSMVGTATDATAMLRVLFSRIAEPNAGGPGTYSFNVPSASGGGAMKVGGKTVRKHFKRTGGMCPACEGTGRASKIDEHEILDFDLSLHEGALLIPGYKTGGWNYRMYTESGFFDPDKKIRDYTEQELADLLTKEPTRMKIAGINMTYEGLIPRIQSSMLSKDREAMQKHIGEFVDRAVKFVECPECHGTRLAVHARESKINGASIADLCQMEIMDLIDWFDGLAAARSPKIAQAAPLVTAIRETLASFQAVGLDYLTLDRPTATLSGGEAQRAKMIRHLGSALTDVTYVFDEPSAGLHPEDIGRMNDMLRQLRDKGNTVLVVEHKPETIAIADHVIDLGPGAGSAGGEVTFEGSVAELRASDTVTGKHLADRIKLKAKPRAPKGYVEIRRAHTNNLKCVDVDIPLGVLTAITGVAGSGKSSLVTELLAKLDGDVAYMDQAAISGSRRSNPATYTGILDPIRKAFAKANKDAGVKPALFSPNSEGACPNCKGAGVVYVDLGFMQGADVVCEVCEGKRFDAEVLEFTLAGRNIAEVLDMPASEAVGYLKEAKVTAAAKQAERLCSVGLGYLQLGQPLTTLSGGERQRLKLAAHLSQKKAPSVVVLDEPTTGLHLADIEVVTDVLDAMVEAGTSVIVIEHNLAVVARADYVIDMGPGAGSHGGEVVFTGTPAELAHQDGATGRHLAQYIRS